MPDKTFYTRTLPHIIPKGETFFVTFRLKNTVPPFALEQLKNEYAELEKLSSKITNTIERQEFIYSNNVKYFKDFDTFLDNNSQNIQHLKQPEIAQVVANALHYHDKKSYYLHCYCIMPNHVHLLCTHIETAPLLNVILGSIKRYSAIGANRILGQEGKPFWQSESYDHLVRNEQSFANFYNYILDNPVKAGLVEHWQDWKFSYTSPE